MLDRLKITPQSLQKGYSPMKLILIHGQSRTPLSMALLSWRLSRQGHEIHYFGYFTFLETFEEIVERFVKRVAEMAGADPYAIISHARFYYECAECRPADWGNFG